MLLAEARKEVQDSPSTGHVTLVGAGPGNPELLTLRALRALRSADVILFDDLVAPEILDFARREAKRMLVGKTGYGPSCKQRLNALMGDGQIGKGLRPRRATHVCAGRREMPRSPRKNTGRTSPAHAAGAAAS